MRRLVVVMLLLTAGYSDRAWAQEWAPDSEWDPGRMVMTREMLQDLLAKYEAGARSEAYSPELRAFSREQAERIRERLETGDISVGDRIEVIIQGMPTLSDTFVVGPDRVLEMPDMANISMEGVLRSEVDEYLAERIGEFVRAPLSRARALVHISVIGQVGSPGFYNFSPYITITDAIMSVGGPTGQAKVDGIRIERLGETVWEGRPLQVAIAEAWTLDRLDLHAGDRVVVPQKLPISFRQATQAFFFITGILFGARAIW